MKKNIIAISFVLVSSLVFSQTTKGETKKEITSADKTNNKVSKTTTTNVLVKPKYVTKNEGTNDPLLNGYTKKIVNGKKVYTKQVGRIKTTYTPSPSKTKTNISTK